MYICIHINATHKKKVIQGDIWTCKSTQEICNKESWSKKRVEGKLKILERNV